MTAGIRVLGPLEAAVDYALKAAERADRRYAYDAAVSLLEQALEAFARTPAQRASGPNSKPTCSAACCGRRSGRAG